MPVAEGGQNAHRVVTDAGQDDPVVGDAQPGQVLVEVPVILQGFVPVSNDQTQARVPGKGGCVLFRIPARAHCLRRSSAWTPLARGVLSSVSCIGPAPIMDTLRNSSG